MKTASAELIALMASNTFRLADIYTFTLKSGVVLRYTSADIAITYNSLIYTPIPVSRGRTRTSIGVEVDTLEVTISPGPDLTVSGSPFLQAAHSGIFDGATVLVEKAYMPSWGNTSAGVLHIFEGEVSDVEIDGLSLYMKVWSMTALLNIQMPRNKYQAPCGKNLYGAACGVIKANFKVIGSVTAGSNTLIVNSALAQAADYFMLGTIEFQTGQNANVIRTVRAYSAGQFTLTQPLAYTPAVGDTFHAYPGCDKSLLTCTNKFNNRPRYRGQPWIPVPESAY